MAKKSSYSWHSPRFAHRANDSSLCPCGQERCSPRSALPVYVPDDVGSSVGRRPLRLAPTRCYHRLSRITEQHSANSDSGTAHVFGLRTSSDCPLPFEGQLRSSGPRSRHSHGSVNGCVHPQRTLWYRETVRIVFHLGGIDTDRSVALVAGSSDQYHAEKTGQRLHGKGQARCET
jgi:hypothetical protein